MVTIVNVQDISSGNNLVISSAGFIGISNWPSLQQVAGTVSIAAFPPIQQVSGTVDVTDRPSRQLGQVTIPTGTAISPAYNIIQDPIIGTNRLKINSDGSINISGSTSVTANAGTNLNTSALALEAGGNLSTLVTNTADLLADGDNLATINTNTSNTATNTSNSATVEGLTIDTAVTGDNPGTISAKLRGLLKIFTDIWDNINHRIKVDGSGVTQPVKAGFVEQLNLSATGANAFLLPSTDVSAYKSFSIQFPPQSTNLGITFQRSIDNTNWDPFYAQHGNGAAGSSFFSPSNYVLSGDIDFHYMRIQITSFTSGTVSANMDFSTLPSNQVFTNTAISDSFGNALLGNQASGNIIGGTFTTTQTSGNIQNPSSKGMILYVNVTDTSGGTASITPTLLGHDGVSTKDGIIWQATTPITAVGFYTYLLYPGLSGTPGATQVASVFLPHDFKLQTVANNANSATYFVNYGLEK